MPCGGTDSRRIYSCEYHYGGINNNDGRKHQHTAPETSESFEELLEKSFKTLNTGDKVTGIVTAIGTSEIQVDVG